MTRRDFLWATALAGTAAQPPVILPIHRVMDSRMHSEFETVYQFWRRIWPEAVRDFGRGGIQLHTTDAKGEIKRSPGDRPVFVGLQRGMINMVLTDHVPMKWDLGRGLSGVTAIWEGYHLCVIALDYAHGDQVPFLSVNTCVHELLHALLLDVYLSDPSWYQTGTREARIDWYATQLWVFHNGRTVRDSARVYLERLRRQVVM
jgi:hypothetical protein